MDKRCFVLSFEESACTIDGLKGTLKTKKVEEKLSDGSLKTVYTEMHFVSCEKQSGYQKLLKLFKWSASAEERGVA